MNSLSIRSKPISQLLKPTSKNLYISLFSTSSLSNSSSLSSSRRYEEDSRNVRVSVWWDIENCGVPVGINVFKIAPSVTNAVRINGIKGPVQITAFGDVCCLSRVNQEALSCTGVKFVHVPYGDKNSADRSLLVNLMLWVSQNPPPVHIFLISNDRDFAGILHKLRMSNYNILLASREHNQPPRVLYSAATIMWHWLELCKGENLSGKHFNQPPDGPHNSWYGHYKGPLEDPFPGAHQQKQSDDDDDVEESESSTGKSKYRPIPIEVLNRIQRVINRHPEGLSIIEIRKKPIKCNVHFDKDFHGCKNFSNFLRALPSIVKVEPRPYGQYFVKPALTESQISVESDCDGDTESDSKEDGKSPTITRMVEVPISPCVDEKEKTVEEKFPEETLENEASFEGTITPKEEYDSVIRHSSMDTTVKDSKLVDNADMAEKSEVNPGFVSKKINWCKFKFWRNELSTDKAIEIPGKEPSFVGGDTREFEDASPSTKLENDSSHFRKHELFTEDSFWYDLRLFFKTHRGFDIVSNSISREHFAETLEKEGLSFLQPLQATDISYLVHLLIEEKKLIKEFPTETPHFRIDHLSGEISSSTQPELNLSSHENPKIKVSSKGHKKALKKPKNEILSDCRNLLNELLSQNPEGFNMGLFKSKFLETYGYTLDHRKLGHPKLFSLLQTMPGIIVDSTYVFPVSKKSTASDSDSDVLDSQWEELGAVKKSNLTKEANSSEDENGVSEDEFSKVESSSKVKGNDNELLKVLDTWYFNKDKGNSKGHPSSSSEDEFSELGEDEAFNKGRKPKSENVYKLVAETSEINKDKLFAGILDSLQDLGGKKGEATLTATTSSKTTWFRHSVSYTIT